MFSVFQSLYFTDPPVPWWQYAATAAAIFAILQLIAILVTPFGDWSIGILGAALLSAFWYFGVFEYLGNTTKYSVSAIVICPLIAWAIVYLQRHGQYDTIILTRLHQRSTPDKIKVQREVGKYFWIRLFIGSLAGLYVLMMIRNMLRHGYPLPQFEGTWHRLTSGQPLLTSALRGELVMYTTLALFVVIGAALGRRLYATIHSTEPFRSATDAQRWFELMRVWPLYLSLFCTALLVQLVRDWTPNLLDHFYLKEWWVALPYKLAWIVGFAAAVSGCVMVFLNFRLQFGPMRAFLYIRPIPSRDLAAARLLAAARTLTLPVIVIVLVYTSAEVVGDTIFNIEELMAGLSIPWMAFWTANAAIAFSGFAILSALIYEIQPIGSYEDYIFGIGALLLAFTATGLFLLAQHQKLLYRRWVIAAPVLVFGVWIGSGLFVRAWHSYGGGAWVLRQVSLTWSAVFPMTTFALIIVMPLLTVPLITHWARHR